MVQRKNRMGAGVTENDGLSVLPNLMADGRLKHQFTTGFQPEIDGIIDGACHPTPFRDSRHRRETHAGEMFDHAQDHRHSINAADGVNV
ncbi:hypothetical protein D3C87_1658380 [compost metagenome]